MRADSLSVVVPIFRSAATVPALGGRCSAPSKLIKTPLALDAKVDRSPRNEHGNIPLERR